MATPPKLSSSTILKIERPKLHAVVKILFACFLDAVMEEQGVGWDSGVIFQLYIRVLISALAGKIIM